MSRSAHALQFVSSKGVRGRRSRVAAIASVALLSAVAAAQGQTVTWTRTGGGTSFWTDASAWQGFAIPGATTANVNFFADTTIPVGTLNAVNNASGYSALTNIVVNGVGTNSGSSSLTVSGTAVTLQPGGMVKINSQFGGDGAGNGLTVNYSLGTTFAGAGAIDASAANTPVFYSPQLLGSGQITISGPSGGNTLRLTTGGTGRVGDTVIAGGVVEAFGAANNFFANSNDRLVTVQNGARLLINVNGAATNSPVVVLNGSGPDGQGALAVANVGNEYNITSLTVASNATLNVPATGPLKLRNFAGRGLAGTGTLTKSGAGTFSVQNGSSAFTVSGVSFPVFSGNVVVSQGLFELATGTNALGPNTAGGQSVSVSSGAVLGLAGGGTALQNFAIAGSGTGIGSQLGALSKYNGGTYTVGSVTLTGNATISTDAGNAISVANLFSGSSTLTKVGTGTLQLNSGNSPFTGDIQINAGTVRLGGDGGGSPTVMGLNPSGTQTVTIASGGATQVRFFAQSADIPQNFVISGSGPGGNGAIFWDALQSFNGDPNGGNGIRGLTVASDATVNIIRVGGNAQTGVAVRQPLAGSGNLTKIGNAGLFLTAANGTFSGNVNVNVGYIELLGVANALGSNSYGTQAVNVASGASAVLRGSGSAPQNFAISGTGANLANAVAALSQYGGGTYTVGSVTLTGDSSVSVGTVSGAGSLVVSGPLDGSSTLTKTGPGTLVVGNTFASPFTGNINVSAGTLQINVNNSLGSGPGVVTVAPGAVVLAPNLFSQRSYPQTFALNGNGTGQGALVMTGMDNFGPNTLIGGLIVQSDATVSLTRNGNGNNNPNTGVRVLSPLAGNGNLTKAGDAALYLDGGTSSYAATVTVNAGTLGLNAVGALGTASLVLRNGSTFAPAVADTLPNALTLGSGGGIVTTAANVELSGAVAGDGPLVKSGTGTVTLTGSSTATGPVTVSAGTLAVGNGGTSGSLGSGAVTINANSVLLLNRSGTGTLSSNIGTTGGTLAARGGGDTTLTGSLATFDGNVEVVGAGTRLTTNSPLRSVTGSLVVTGPGAGFTFAVPVGTSGYTVVGELPYLSVGPLSKVAVAPTARTADNASVLVASTLDLSGNTGFLDLGNNDMVVRGAGVSGLGSVRGAIAAWLAQGNGSGLGSSAAGVGGVPTTLGAVLNSADGEEPLAYFTSYDGVTSLATDDVIVKYTYVGDTNLDGKLDGSDLVNLIEGLSTGATGWQNGDVNYDGVIDGADYAAFSAALAYYANPANNAPQFGNGSGIGGNGGAVPEPAALGLLAAAVPLASRRRRTAH